MNKLSSWKKEFPFHITKRSDICWWKSLLARFGAVLFGMVLLCLLLLIFVGANPIAVLEKLFQGCFSSPRRIWITFRDTALVLTVALALVPAFKMKFWNLGGNGQILMGDLMAIVCMFYMGKANCPDWAIILVSFLSSILAGMIWALIPAIFKAFFNTNESLFTLMMNYIAAGLVSVFLSAVVTSGSGTLSIQEKGQFPQIAGNNYLLSILVSIVVLAAIFVYLRFSKRGYELEVVGESRNTAKYIGINVKKVILRTMALSGALCGLVGFLFASSIDHTITAESARNLGFTAIMVAWLAKFNPLAMFGTAFLVAFLDNGMSSVQTAFSITNDSIGEIAIGLVYFCIIAVEFFISYRIVKKHVNTNAKETAKALANVNEEKEGGK